jgi:voltage-gated potassium channel
VKNSDPSAVAPRRGGAMRLGIRAAVQIALSMAVLGAIYFLVPTNGLGPGTDLPWLVLELGLFALVVGLQVPAIINSDFPIMRAIVALGVVVPLYLLIFARVYLSGSYSDPSTFSEPLDHASALYFTVTVFATVGFGDIVAKTDTMRMLVTAQMLVNLIVVGAGIRILISAARRGIEARDAERPLEEAMEDPPSEPA